MKLVKNNQPVTFKAGVVLQQAKQHALRHHFNSRALGEPAFQAHAVTDGFTRLFAEHTGHTLGCKFCGNTARLQHQNPLAPQPFAGQQGERYAGGLARAGFSHHNGLSPRLQGAQNVGHNLVNGK